MQNICRSISMLGLAIVIAIAGLSLHTVEVLAGSSDIIIDNTSFAEELDATVWNNPSAELIVKDGKILLYLLGYRPLFGMCNKNENNINIKEYEQSF